MSTPDREETLHSLRSGKTFDLLIIGGGATGCGIALDAASRGLEVALVEKNDFAEGTSGRSTKLLHGGVRYLESAVRHLDPAQYRLVREGLKERDTLLRIAPHLCRRLPLVTPLYRWMEVPYVFAGLKLYDVLAGSKNIGHSRLLRRSKALESFPMLRSEGLRAGVSYYDGQFNDARMALTLAMTAEKFGATVVNHVAVEVLHKTGGRVTGAGVRDFFSEAGWDVSARAVINAAGPLSDRLRTLDDAGAEPMLTVSSGTHLVLGKEFSPEGTGLLIPRTEDGRVLFIVPWEGMTLVGTTDEPATPSEHPRPTEAEIDYLVHYVCRYFDLDFSRSDIKSAWSGLRPLVSDPGSADTAELSRDHILEESPAGLLTVAGGKWTTYRRMASDAVDHAVKRFNLNRQGGCRTQKITLLGGADPDPAAASSPSRSPHGDPAAEHLKRTYGDQAALVADTAAGGYERALAEGYPYIEGEVLWAVRREKACRAMDVLARRTPLALLDTEAARTASVRVIEIMARELRWDPLRRKREEEEVGKRLSDGI